MTKKRSGLGKGLDALIPQVNTDGISVPDKQVFLVPIENIKPNPRQPRVDFNTKELKELSDSISKHGIIQPLIVTRGSDFSDYILIAGERRLLAARDAGLNNVPVIIREASEQDSLEIALIENIQRLDLNAIERAEAYQQLLEDFGLTHDEIGKIVGKSRVSITNSLRLLNLPKQVQQAISSGAISEGHARALLQLPTPQSQIGALRTIIDRQLNVRQSEELARKLTGEKPAHKPKGKPSPEITAIEENLRQKLGTKVTINHAKHRGRIIIHYYSEEELNALVEFLAKE